jgi:hypothetical protein
MERKSTTTSEPKGEAASDTEQVARWSKRAYAELPAHIKWNINDMARREKVISEVIHEELEAGGDDVVARINKRIADVKKLYTEYKW